jgi:two-component system sensor histidine kinase KdpD
MPFSRPDPDELLRQVQETELRQNRGKLKIFLGASPGVGKTYAMLSEAHEQKDRGVDVVAGYVETHGRKETDALLLGLETIPPIESEYRNVQLREFDIDSALKRHPQLLLVDELAHTNVPNSRHPKRYMDVEELLRSGIDVYTTVNVQHLESLNDVVAQITGVTVRETVPDSLVAGADEMELVDIPPKELLQRLKEGKVYVPDRAEQAMQSFFREGNLIALRELALRRTADRVDAQMQSYRTERGVDQLWPTRERILVCIAPNRMATRLVRSARRMAEATHADCIALYVESDRQSRRPPEELAKARRAILLAESLGMEIVNLSGHDIVNEVLRFAKRRNVTQIIVGKPIKPRWKELLFGSVVDEMVRNSGDINIHVITGEAEASPTIKTVNPIAKSSIQSVVATVAMVAAASILSWFFYDKLELSNLVMFYLLAVALVSSRFGAREAVIASVLSVGAFDFFFVPPRFTFSVSDTQYLVTFAVMLAVGLIISSLTQTMRSHLEYASGRERRTSALFALSRKLVRTRSKVQIAEALVESVKDVFDGTAALLTPTETGALAPLSGAPDENIGVEVGVADWAFMHGEPAGVGTDTLPGSSALYLPLQSTIGTVGILFLKPSDSGKALDSQQMDLLAAFANQAAIALERAQLAKESHNARVQIETERLRNSLLSSVSHDLRTPLTSITGAASTLMQGKASDEQQLELATTIYEESDRLNRLVRNLLDMTRLESGQLRLNLQWHSLEELIGSAASRTESLFKQHKLELNVADNLPLVNIDGVLMEQVLINLLENEARHTPPGTLVKLNALVSGGFVRVEITDNGPGLKQGEEESIFEKFQRGEEATGVGFGLGLAICRAVLQAHGAQIWARNGPEGGALFVFELKIEPNPAVPHEN